MGQEAKAVINKIIQGVLHDHEVRKNLDSDYHILDLSYASISTANTRDMRTSRTIHIVSYMKFMRAIRADTSSRGCLVPTVEIALEKIADEKGACLVDLFLVCRNFNQARDTISRVSGTPELINDPSFGQTYRERNLSEYNIPAGMTSGLSDLKGKAFIQANGIIGQVAEKPITEDRSNYSWYEEISLGKFTKIGYYASRADELSDTVTIANLVPEFVGCQISVRSERDSTVKSIGQGFSTTRDIALYEDEQGNKYPFVKRNRLSVLDLGHGYLDWSSTGRTPLGNKLENVAAEALLIGDPRISASVRMVIEKYQKDLADKHSVVKWTFHNTVPSKGWGNTPAASIIKFSAGFVVLTVQHYKQNNALAVHEGRIRRQVEQELLDIIRWVPGSNTITQDIVEDITNVVLRKIGGKPRKLKPHVPIGDKVDVTPIAARATTSTVSGPKKTKKSGSSTKPAPLRLRSNSGRFTSLISLQNLLNQGLASQIQKNMGTGERKDILNYRTGRFAESAKVEKMSSSREGMITAFYSYMRNPYATFSFGGQQSSPASRDPKLLISRSIREIGATMVGNRMRAVLV
jgi:hypothetical protein